MSIKQDRIGTRTAEDLRQRLNVGEITETGKKVDASVEQVQKLSNEVTNLSDQVTGLNNTVTNTRESYVSTNAQTFTDEQKARARKNIGAGNSSFSGSYEELIDKPFIPARTSELINDSKFVASTSLSTVATSGDYDDLNDKPTIPTKTSQLENDAGFITDSGSIVPINVVNEESTSTTDTYSCDYVNTMENNIQDEIGKLKLRIKTITGLSLAAGTTYQLTLPANTVWIEPLVECWGNSVAGGTFVPIGVGHIYINNIDTTTTAGAYRGIWVSCNSAGLVHISDYRHCEQPIVGFRIWYLGTE